MSQCSLSPEVETVVAVEDIARELIEDEYRRTVSNYSDLYFLPLDEEERERLCKFNISPPLPRMTDSYPAFQESNTRYSLL
jgi:hypothetical protein